MGESDASAFGKFVPGFDFLQSLAKGATGAIPQMPNLGNWVAPTLNVEELDKRIEELKNVQFWLEQNSRALTATIQALEVQKMTLATLKGMNFNIAEMANAFKPKVADVASKVEVDAEEPAEEPKTQSSRPAARKTTGKTPAAKAGAALVDPLQLWGSLAQQFQTIAAGAIKEAASKTAVDLTRTAATGLAKGAIKTAKAAGKKVVTKRPATRKRS
jgi:hypothetical protein